MSKQHCRMLQVERFFRQSGNKLNMFNLLRICRKDEISRKTRSTLLPVASALLLVWTGFYTAVINCRQACTARSDLRLTILFTHLPRTLCGRSYALSVWAFHRPYNGCNNGWWSAAAAPSYRSLSPFYSPSYELTARLLCDLCLGTRW